MNVVLHETFLILIKALHKIEAVLDNSQYNWLAWTKSRKSYCPTLGVGVGLGGGGGVSKKFNVKL